MILASYIVPFLSEPALDVGSINLCQDDSNDNDYDNENENKNDMWFNT